MTDQLDLVKLEEVEETEAGSVLVGEQRRDVHHYTTGGSVATLGTIITRNYRGEQAQRHFFHAAPEPGKTAKTYKLGVTTTRFRFVDHTVALDPLINRGYTIKDTVISRGGMNMYAVLEKPNAQPLVDPIEWDLQFWHDHSGSGLAKVPRELHESVVVFSSVKPGKGIKYSRGWFRLICSNGLVAEILKLGSVLLSHNQWNAPIITQKLNILPELSEMMEVGPLAGNRQGVRRFAGLLDQFASLPDVETQDPEDGMVSPSIQTAVRDLPLFVQDEVTTLLSMPIWFRQAMAEQFKAMADGTGLNQKIFVLDVINAITNPINLERFSPGESPRSVLRPLMRTSAMTSAATKLIGAFSL